MISYSTDNDCVLDIEQEREHEIAHSSVASEFNIYLLNIFAHKLKLSLTTLAEQ